MFERQIYEKTGNGKLFLPLCYKNISSDMHILLVSATRFEVGPLLSRLTPSGPVTEHFCSYRYKEHRADLLVPGVGMLKTAFHLGYQLAGTAYDVAINAGIAGTLRDDFPIGTVVKVEEDTLPELAAQEDGRMVSFFELGLIDPDAAPFRNGILINTHPLRIRSLESIPRACGSTVNTLYDLSDPMRPTAHAPADVETMEGAAFLYGCLSAGVPCLQLRAVSNVVGERDKSKWDISGAVKALNKILGTVLDEL